jgi:hypothetical protein
VCLRHFKNPDVNHHFSSEERLTALRGLIERKDRYRAAFARIAFIAGLLSILTAAAIFMNDEITRFLDRPVRPREFAFAWVVVLLVTLASGIALWRTARERGETSGSARMKLVLGNAAPCLLIPAAFTAWFFGTGYLGGTELDLVVVWVASYGLMLLSTTFFAPRSIVILGWAFLLTALSIPMLGDLLDVWIGDVPTVLMGTCYGLYHLIYAALNWRGRASNA